VLNEFELYLSKNQTKPKSKREQWRFDVWSHTPISYYLESTVPLDTDIYTVTNHTPIKTYQGLGSFNPDLYIFDDFIPEEEVN
jgi:hypothetical protein